MKFTFPPANRIVAFAGPYISLLSGAAASWLVVHVQVLGSLNIGQNRLANGLAYAATAGIGAVIPHLGFKGWLSGHQSYTDGLFRLVETLDPGIRTQVLTELPKVNGELLTALQHALGGGAASGVPALSAAGDSSGDIEQPNPLVDVAAPPLDPPPAAFGDDSVHAPPTDPPPGPQSTPGESDPVNAAAPDGAA